jgi:hypothetical protein
MSGDFGVSAMGKKRPVALFKKEKYKIPVFVHK